MRNVKKFTTVFALISGISMFSVAGLASDSSGYLPCTTPKGTKPAIFCAGKYINAPSDDNNPGGSIAYFSTPTPHLDMVSNEAPTIGKCISTEKQIIENNLSIETALKDAEVYYILKKLQLNPSLLASVKKVSVDGLFILVAFKNSFGNTLKNGVSIYGYVIDCK